jgi:perosamine synthetase
MLGNRIADAIRASIGHQEGLVLLHEPYLPPRASQYVQECIDTGWVSSAGSYVGRFEQLLVEYTRCTRAVATVNGTAALQMCMYLAGVKPGDEVLSPSLSFVATANAISHAGGIPHFVDVDPSRLAICPDILSTHLADVASVKGGVVTNRQTGRRLAAVCVMHGLGHPADLNAIADVCQRYGLPLIEDAAESLGSFYRGKHTGSYGLLSAVSFNGNKIVTTGGGGAILTNDVGLADRAKHLTTTAKVPHAWEFNHDEVGWNYRLPNVNAALGCAQLEILPKLVEAKRYLATVYAEQLSSIAEIKFIAEPGESQSNYWLNGFVLSPSVQYQRDEILKILNEAGYQSRPLWKPLHGLPMYQSCPRSSLANTISLCQRTINIPSSARLSPLWSEITRGLDRS